ncbi:MAG: Holliday junction resolvase RuvX [Chloroflexota bacterium]
MRVLGLDVGRRRIGVAVSDPTGLIASPLEVIQVRSLKGAISRVLDICREQQAELIVVGLPVSLAGELGPQAREVLEFTEALRRRSPVPVETWDERLSTVGATRLLQAGGYDSRTMRDRLDAAAAAFMLQGYLDSRRRRAETDQ